MQPKTTRSLGAIAPFLPRAEPGMMVGAVTAARDQEDIDFTNLRLFMPYISLFVFGSLSVKFINK
jgi:hypothetical protein